MTDASHQKKEYLSKRTEDSIVLNLFIVTFLTTLAILPIIFDSFTLSKIFVLSSGISIILIRLFFLKNRIKYSNLSLSIILWPLFFFISIFVSLSSSEVPLIRGMFGQFGRGNGLFYYFFAFTLFALLSLFYERRHFRNLEKMLFGLSWILSVYALFQNNGRDFWDLETGGLSPVVLTLGNSNFSGSMLAVLFSFHSTVMILRRQFSFAHSATSIMLLLGCYVTDARQGFLIIFLSLAVSISLLLFTRYQRGAVNWVLAVTWLIGTFLTVLGLLGKSVFAPIFEIRTFQIRIEYWKIAWNVFLDNFLFGVGPDNFYNHSSKYMAPDSTDLISLTRIDNAHNWFLNVAVNYGVLSGLLFATFVAAVFWKLSIVINLHRAGDKCLDGLMVGVPFISVFLSGLVSIEQPGIGIWLYFFAGVIFAIANRNAEKSQEQTKKLLGMKPGTQLALRRFLFYTGLSVSLVATVLICSRVLLDYQLRANIQTVVGGKGTLYSVDEIESIAINLKSEPEYAVIALRELAKIGASRQMDNISTSVYEYDSASVQSNWIRANVLRALNRESESCVLVGRLIRNSPWDPYLLEKYVICLMSNFTEPNYRDSLKSSKAYLGPIEKIENEISIENALRVESFLYELGFRSRLSFLLGDISEARKLQVLAKSFLQELDDFYRQNPSYIPTLQRKQFEEFIRF